MPRAGTIEGAYRVASIFKMMEVSRHKSVDRLWGYVRRADLFSEHAGAIPLNVPDRPSGDWLKQPLVGGGASF
jgi:hypothetical protein